jgi:hypothetical protein
MYVAMVAERASALAGLDGDMHTHMHGADEIRKHANHTPPQPVTHLGRVELPPSPD